MFTIYRKTEICAAHQLENHKGHCKNLHGHNYIFEIWISSYTLDENGFVIDFGDISSLLKDNYDHTGQIIQVTAENLAETIVGALGNMLKTVELSKIKVRVWETSNSYAEFEKTF